MKRAGNGKAGIWPWVLGTVLTLAILTSTVFLGILAIDSLTNNNAETRSENTEKNDDKTKNGEKKKDSRKEKKRKEPTEADKQKIVDNFLLPPTMVGAPQEITEIGENKMHILLADGDQADLVFDPNEIGQEIQVGQSMGITFYEVSPGTNFVVDVFPWSEGEEPPPLNETKIIGVAEKTQKNKDGSFSVVFDAKFSIEGGQYVKDGKLTVNHPPADVLPKIKTNKWNIIRVTEDHGLLRIIFVAN